MKHILVAVLFLYPFFLIGQSKILENFVTCKFDSCIKNEGNYNLNAIQNVADSLYTTNLNDNNAMQLACVYHQLGVQYYGEEEYVKSINYYLKARSIRLKYNDGMSWKSYYGLGICYYYGIGNNKLAKSYFIDAYNTKGNKVKRNYISRIESSLCNLYREMADYEKAIFYGELAIEHDTSNDNLNDAHMYFYQALIFENSEKNLQKAILKLESAIAEKSAMNHPNLCHFYALLGLAYRRLQKNSKSIHFNNKAIEIVNPNSDLYTTYQNNKAVALYQNKDHNKAIKLLLETLKKNENLLENDSNKSKIADNYENVGENYEALGELNKALESFHKAIMYYTNTYRNEDINSKLPKYEEDKDLYIYFPTNLSRNLNHKGRIACKIYDQTGDKSYLNIAKESFESLIYLQKTLFEQITSESSRLIQSAINVPYIENALKVAHSLKIEGEDYESFAFKLIEFNKAIILLQTINESKALKYANLPDSLLVLEEQLKDDIGLFRKLSYEKKQAIYIDSLKVADSKYQYLINQIEHNHPKYYNLKYQQHNTNLKQVQNQLDNSSALIEYFVGDTTIYLMTIQKEKVDFYQIKKPLAWQTNIKNLSDAIIYNYNNYVADAYALYQIILEKPLSCLNEGIKHIQIIPDAELNNIPFAALLTAVPKSDSVNYAKLSYLFNQYLISYAYSAKLSLEAQKEKEHIAANKYVAFLAEDSVKINQYCNQFVNNISNGLDGEIFMDDSCSVRNFKANANKYQIINLIMHGCGTLGALTFNDAELFDTDIYATDLSNTRLINLTACETNTGTLQKGEGIMSLSRAFTYAGCPSLVSTLWSVHPESTCVITELFFEEIKNGKAIDEALWAAQKEYMKDYVNNPNKIDPNINAHPYYWAGIIPIGKMDKIVLK